MNLLIGYRKKLYSVNLTFSLVDFPHLAGFQYLKDISLPNYNSSKIADRILEGKIRYDKIKTSFQYTTMIEPRLEALVHLKKTLDHDFKLFSYLPSMYPFFTRIKADYLISGQADLSSVLYRSFSVKWRRMNFHLQGG